MSDTSMLHACASVVQCSGKPEAKRLSDWLWNYADSLADRLEEDQEEDS